MTAVLASYILRYSRLTEGEVGYWVHRREDEDKKIGLFA